jgi:hypothetical protein
MDSESLPIADCAISHYASQNEPGAGTVAWAALLLKPPSPLVPFTLSPVEPPTCGHSMHSPLCA